MIFAAYIGLIAAFLSLLLVVRENNFSAIIGWLTAIVWCATVISLIK